MRTFAALLWLTIVCYSAEAGVIGGDVHLRAAMDVSSEGFLRRTNPDRVSNATSSSSSYVQNPFWQSEQFKEIKRGEKVDRKKRIVERQKKAKEVLKKMGQPARETLERVSPEEFAAINEKQQQQKNRGRGLSWWSGAATSDAYSSGVLIDPSQYYDKWAQAYRMLGGFIDCDHDKDSGSGSGGDNNNNNGDDSACSRWMVWAAYVNPNYQGNEYYEYFGDNPTSVLDCHSPDTEWELLGVYRQEFYQFIEQISKHLWAIDEYEYVVALAGLAYMTDYDCFYVGADNSGNSIYAGVAPQPYGKFEMALYTDGYCLTPDDSLGMTYDDFGLGSDLDLGSKDDGDTDYDSLYEYWYDSQEYTLTNLNDVYEEFKYCTSCVDYPTYQDGYFIGDDGTDDDDLINQCWKFYSHDSFTCEADCISMAHAQGTILSIQYGDTLFGKTDSGFYQSGRTSEVKTESRFSRLLANAFLTVSFLLFVATFLAFAVARRSRYRESRSSKSRRLLDDEDGKSRKSRRSSKSRGTRSPDGDGLFRQGTSSRSKSRDKRSSSSRKRSGSKSKRSRSKSYEAPKTKSSRSKDNEEYF